MSGCEANTSTGKDVVVEFIIGCIDAAPVEADWKVLGAMKTKELNASYDTEDVSADDIPDDVRANITTFKNFSFSGDGLIRNVGQASEDLTELYLHFFNAKKNKMQPAIWLRVTDPKLTHVAPVIITEFSHSYPNDSSISFSLSTMATFSLIGTSVDKTPKPTTKSALLPKGDK